MIPDSTRVSLQLRYGEIFSTVIEGKEIIFRALTLSEYKQIALTVGEDLSGVDLEDMAVQFAVVHPQLDIDRMKAGHVAALAEEILKVSGFTDEQYLVHYLSAARQDSDEVSFMMKAFILATMPAYTEEDLNELTIKQLLDKVALAEKIIEVQQASLGIPEEYAVKFALVSSEEQIQQPQRSKPSKEASKEQIISKLIATEGEMTGKRISEEALKNFDEDSLTLMMGIPKQNDPFADKLFKAMGG